MQGAIAGRAVVGAGNRATIQRLEAWQVHRADLTRAWLLLGLYSPTPCHRKDARRNRAN